jgi:hypothetical protein
MTGDIEVAEDDETCARGRQARSRAATDAGQGASDKNDGLAHNSYPACKTTHDRRKRPAIIRLTRPDRDYAASNLSSAGAIEKDFVGMALYLASMVAP